MSKRILLMYLGGETNTPNLLKHWKIMNEIFINKDNYYIVIHPKILENYKINNVFIELFNPRNIFIVDENHHLLTGWASRSLTDATLMMMQYAHTQINNNFFDKYVLLSSSCIPLYNLDEIYNVLILNNKSWIFGNFQSRDIFNHSQWFILDKTHAIYFFNNHNSNTYIKKLEINICTTFNNKKINTQNIYINNHNNLDYKNYFNSYHNCKLSDETFFGTFILIFNKIDNSIMNNVNGRKDRFFSQNIHVITENEKINKLKNIPIIIKNKLLEITKNIKDIYYIKPIKTDKINTCRNNKELYNDVIIYTNGLLNELTFAESCPSTFLNFPDLSITPKTVIRDFNLFTLDLHEFINSESLPSDTFNFLDTNIQKSKLKQNIIKCLDDSYNRLEEITTSIATHPIEYSCWTLQNMLNVYIFLIFFRCYAKNKDFDSRYFPDDYRNNSASDICFRLYQKIIFKEFLIKDDYNIYYNIYYDLDFYKCLIQDFDIKIKEGKININKKFGTFIINSTLLSGYMNGSLFIRKCDDTCLIEEYSHILKMCKYDYEIDSEPIKELIIGKYDISTHTKYLKYKKKYLQFKK